MIEDFLNVRKKDFFILQTQMNVQMEVISVMVMLPVITLLDPSPVLVIKDSVDLVKSAMVRIEKFC